MHPLPVLTVACSLISIQELQPEDEVIVPLSDGDTVNVWPLDANHCPGSLMFVFDGKFGRVMHTGALRSDDYSHSVVLSRCSCSG